MERKIRSRSAVVSVVGLGHVGLPLAVTFAEAGYQTLGVDSDPEHLERVRSTKLDPQNSAVQYALSRILDTNKLRLTGELREAVKESDCVLICVPTPVDYRKRPDTSIISKVLRTTGKCILTGKLVVIESTVYPSFTDYVAKRLLEASGMKCGIDFALAHSPQRIDPGNIRYHITQIPKVVGGVDPDSGTIAALLYKSVMEEDVINVCNARTAECVKMLENVYRFVNIALVNELALLYRKIGVDIFEVVQAASSKPFGFHPHYPGPGVGGPCIPKDHFYLRYTARQVGAQLKLVEISASINRAMPMLVAGEVLKELKRLRLQVPKVAIFGMAYKAESSETVNSSAIKVISRLLSAGTKVTLHDPYVSSVKINRRVLACEDTAEAAATQANCLLFLVDHEAYRRLKLSSLKEVVAERCLLFDTKNLFKAKEAEEAGFRYIAWLCNPSVGSTCHNNPWDAAS